MDDNSHELEEKKISISERDACMMPLIWGKKET
jgi:hypothetical protein